MRRLKCFICLPVLFCSLVYGNETGPLVQTNVGLIRGVRAEDGNYSLFMGIPYARVDENNPFGAAIPVQDLEGIFEAYDDSAICPQVEEVNNTIIGTLDCLHINVYVPDAASTTNKLPVLVWIYGGGFMQGFAGRYLYGPKFLVRHDIILVTLNYRLGPYGFMNLETPEVPGNAGLKDQKLALQWIKNNIEDFGGDPNTVTIYGVSAGGAAVDLHYLFGDHSLFDKLIIYSASSMNPVTIGIPDLNATLKLAEYFGHSTENNNDAIQFLSTVDPLQLIAANQALGIGYGVYIEKEFSGVERFVREHPLNYTGPDASNKSVLFGYNRDEFHSTFATTLPENFPALSDVFRNSLQNYFHFDSTQLNKTEAVVRQFYMGDESFNENVRSNLGNFMSDFGIIHGVFRSLRRYVQNGCQNVYHFVFSYSGNRNVVKHQMNLTHLDLALHADEVGYLFDVSYMDTPSVEDQLTIDRMTTMWANFVKYGNPNPTPTELLPVIWNPATEDTIPYLELTSEVKVGGRHTHDRMAFWDLFYELHQEAQIGLVTSAASRISIMNALLLVIFFLLL